MKGLHRDWRTWAGLIGVFLVLASLSSRPALGHSLLKTLAKFVLADAETGSLQEQNPLPPAVDVGGPSTAGGVQLTDMTAQYQKTDLVIQTSTGPFGITRTFRSNLGIFASPFGNFQAQSQWWWNGLTGYALYDSRGQGSVLLPAGCKFGPMNPDCLPTRHADYVIEDPDTGVLLTYYSRTMDGGFPYPTSGFQIPGDASNPSKLYLVGTGTHPTGFVLLKPNVHYVFGGWPAGVLSEVQDTQYRTVATISYTAGFISGVTTADGVEVLFNNSDAGLVQSLSVTAIGTGSPTTVATYSYDGGLVSRVVYNESSSVGENYSYGTSGGAFAVTSLTGRPVISYVIDAGYSGFTGNGAVSAQTTEETTLALTGSYLGPSISCDGGADWCQTNTISDSSVTSGDGTWAPETLTTAYTLMAPQIAQDSFSHIGTGQKTSSIAVSCPTCNAQTSWQFNPGMHASSPDGTDGEPPYSLASISANNGYAVYQGAGLASPLVVPADAGFYLPPEYPIILSGALDATGAGALLQQTRTYVYGGVAQPIQNYMQLVNTTQQPSPFGGVVTTYHNWDMTNNRVNSVVRVGTTSVDSSFSLVQKGIGKIYTHDALGRVTEIDGPCFVTGTAPIACDTPASAPVVTYAYYGAGTGFNSNRLMTKTVCTGAGCAANTSTALVTMFSAYDARGRATSSTDPNGVITQLTYDGELLAFKLVKTAAGGVNDATEYTYDGDQLLVTESAGMYDVTCHRIGASDTGCTMGGTPSKYIQWKARCSSPACSAGSVSAKVVYQYKHGFVSSETYYDANGQIRRVVRHDRDPMNRPTFDAVGDLTDTVDTTYSSRAAFDNDGNQTAVGLPFNAAPPFCSSGTSTSCSSVTFDRLDRLATLTEPPVRSGSSQMTVSYDTLGNVSSINFNGQVATYTYDDFGNLLKISAPWLGRGLPIQYAYDAQAHIIVKHTPAMASGEYLQYDYDRAGRPLDLKHVLGGTTTLWALSYDASTTQGTNCPIPGAASFTFGRVQIRTDSFGQTWYSYNFRGQVVGEVRVRAGGGACLPLPATWSCEQSISENNPNTAYFYGTFGQLLAMQYPHGRTVVFNYGSDHDGQRVASVGVGLTIAGVCTVSTLLSNVTWEPFGGLRGYEIDAPTSISSAKAAVEYLQGDNSTVSTMTSCSGVSRPSSTSSDHSGRLRALWVSSGTYVPYSPTGTGNIFARQYTWQGNQLSTQASCLLQTSGTPLTENFFSSSAVPGYNPRLQLEHASRPPLGKTNTGGAWGQRDYAYDPRGNRVLENADCWNWQENYANGNDQLTSRSVTGSSCSSACLGSPPTFLTTSYTYDAEGRVAGITSPSDSSGPASSLSFDATIDGQTAVGSVYKAVTINGSGMPFEYWYDVNGQRRLKVYPDGEQDEFFYGLSSEMIEDHENCPSCGTNTLDEYVWVGGRPVILLRGSLTSAGNLNSDYSGICADFGVCGVYFPVTDYLGKPVLLLDSSIFVVGAADYDPFGHVNRVMGAGDTPHPYAATTSAQVVAGFRQTVPSGASYAIIARGRLAMVDTDSATTAFASMTDLRVNPIAKYPSGTGNVGNVGGPHLGASTTDWGYLPNGSSSFPWQFQMRFTAASASGRSGVAIAGYEYRKYQLGSTPTWLPIRFPGQYYDSETDLFQNWNRFYNAEVGRYLEPEIMWLYPEQLLPVARNGRAIPVYGYAGNNPIGNVDPDGHAIMFNDGKGTQFDIATMLNDLTQEQQNAYNLNKDAIEAMKTAVNNIIDGPDLGYSMQATQLRDSKTYNMVVTPVAIVGAQATTSAEQNGSKTDINPPSRISATTWDHRPNSFELVFVHELGHALYNFSFSPGIAPKMDYQNRTESGWNTVDLDAYYRNRVYGPVVPAGQAGSQHDASSPQIPALWMSGALR
jgi:RHS repeat-associated protein